MLIVGASGILAPAAATLVARGAEVTGISLTRAMPRGVDALHVDGRSTDALRAALGDRRWMQAIVYLPAVSEESQAVIADAVDGRVVQVRTSAAADPARGELRLDDDVLQLGWTPPPVRWHTPAEVSDAALRVLETGVGEVLGVVRPWTDRP